MGAFFTSLLAKIAAVAGWFGSLFVSVFASLWDILRDIFAWLFDQVLSVAVAAIQAIDLSALSGAPSFGTVPASIGNVLSVLGVGTAITMITAAIGIRLVLQLIPFVRLGS